MTDLTPKQPRFVREYLVDLNATQAAIRARYSSRTACSQGQRLLSNVEVAAALELAVGKRSERTQITADDVLREAWAIATTKTFPAAARVSALALCARHTGGFSEKIEHTGASGGGIAVDVRVVLAGLTHEQVERLADGSDH